MAHETIKLDIRGQICPSCLLLTLREINRHHDDLMVGHASLEVFIDSRDATSTIPEAVKNLGLTATVNKLADCYQLVIDRRGDHV